MQIEHIRLLLDYILALGICSSRILGFCSISIFFSSQYLIGTARRATILAFTGIVVPPFYISSLEALSNNRCLFFLFLIKEILLGIILGWLTNFIFYAAQSVGFIIDTQRGASMASLFDPLSNSQTSPLGDFLMKFVMIIAIASGGLSLFLKILYFSYEKIPIFSMIEPLKASEISFFNHAMGTNLFNVIAILGGPILFILFLAEFGLGLVTRFAPQLNVFFLSMPIKSELAMFFFILYLSHLARYFCRYFEINHTTEQFLQLLTQ